MGLIQVVGVSCRLIHVWSWKWWDVDVGSEGAPLREFVTAQPHPEVIEKTLKSISWLHPARKLRCEPVTRWLICGLFACDEGIESFCETTLPTRSVVAMDSTLACHFVKHAASCAKGCCCLFGSWTVGVQRVVKFTNGDMNSSFAPPIQGSAFDILTNSFFCWKCVSHLWSSVYGLL